MLRHATILVAAAALVLGLYSGSLLLALAALCGAAGIAALANDLVEA